MSKSSKQTYADPANQIKFESHRERCLHGLEFEWKGMTYRGLARKIGLKPDQVWKRLSELLQDDKVVIIGVKQENGNPNSVYKLNRQPQLFPLPKKQTLRAWLKLKYPDIWREWNSLY